MRLRTTERSGFTGFPRQTHPVAKQIHLPAIALQMGEFKVGKPVDTWSELSPQMPKFLVYFTSRFISLTRFSCLFPSLWALGMDRRTCTGGRTLQDDTQ